MITEKKRNYNETHPEIREGEMGESEKEEEEPKPAYIGGRYVFRAPGTGKFRTIFRVPKK